MKKTLYSIVITLLTACVFYAFGWLGHTIGIFKYQAPFWFDIIIAVIIILWVGRKNINN